MNEAQKKALEMIKNVMTPENLQLTVSFTSLFVLVFECFKDMVIDRPKEFFCTEKIEFKEDKIVYYETEKYKREVRKLANKPFEASLRWFANHKVITESDVNKVLSIELRRHSFVHELYNVVHNGISDEDTQLLADLVSIYKKIDSWWIYNVEIDWDEIKDPDNVKQDECISSSLVMIDVMINILLKGEGETYRECLAQIKETVTSKTKR
ncbi:MAG: hypothetical protein E7043_06475 [Lentisphaerae bacterium]|nr:hypothetical protein [Lentisphaerota bacterium]